jgi:hypothetical protein
VKKPALWLILAVAAFAIGLAFKLRRPPTPPAPVTAKPAPFRPPPSASPFSPPPNQAAAPKPKPFVAIEDGKTLDFSSGAPILKDTAQEKAIIDKSLKEMEDALKNVSFGPPANKEPGK